MEKKKVLFLCTGNSCRSQMAEGFLRSMAEDRFEAYSAGVDPVMVNPLAVRVMGEIGIDISGQTSKSAVKFLEKKFDYVVTVCDNARESCPVFLGNFKKLHWDLEDPAKAKGEETERLVVFRKIRYQIKEYVQKFIEAS